MEKKHIIKISRRQYFINLFDYSKYIININGTMIGLLALDDVLTYETDDDVINIKAQYINVRGFNQTIETNSLELNIENKEEIELEIIYHIKYRIFYSSVLLSLFLPIILININPLYILFYFILLFVLIIFYFFYFHEENGRIINIIEKEEMTQDNQEH